MFTIKKLVNAVEEGVFFYASSRIVIACCAGFYAGRQISRGIDATTLDAIGRKSIPPPNGCLDLRAWPR